MTTFSRYDVDNDSIITYWMDNGGDLAPVKTVSFEEIVIFTYLCENYAYDSNEDWMKDCGLPTSTGPSVFFVDR